MGLRVAALGCVLVLQGATAPALANPSLEAATVQQALHHGSVQLSRFPITHQGRHHLNIQVSYTVAQVALAPSGAALRQAIQTFLAGYLNEDDFWEIVNRNLVVTLLAQYPQLSRLTLDLGVVPSDRFPHWRGSIVTYEAGQLREFWYFLMPLPEADLATVEAEAGPGPTLRIAYEYHAPDGTTVSYPDYYTVMDSVTNSWGRNAVMMDMAAIAAAIEREHRSVTGVDLRVTEAIAVQDGF